MLSIISISLKAQPQTSFKMSSGSKITVTGTSNIHAWTMTASSFNSDGILTLEGQQLRDLQSLSFSLPVTNLKSKEDLMDTRAYKALKGDQFSRITFKLTEATVIPSQKLIKATGNLTIAGKTNLVTIHSNYSLSGDEITFKGSRSIKMNDYGIKAPSFMLGALKTGNDVTIDILLKLKKSNSSIITKN
ncbi:MAG: YceI family protein [Daejeonella sp.]